MTTEAGSTVTSADGIALNNRGRGDAFVTVGGDILFNRISGNEVTIANYGNAGSASVTTTAGSFIYSQNRGINILNGGTGVSAVNVNGDVIANGQDGIYVNNTGSAAGISVATSSGTSAWKAANTASMSGTRQAGPRQWWPMAR